jgi:phenylacetate-CoA ligase
MWKGTVYLGTPSLLEYLIEQTPKVIGKEVKDLGFKFLVCGAEPGAGIPEIRHKLETAYGAKMFDIGAGLGMSCEHPEYQGMHWHGEDLAYYELVDPDTKQPIPFTDGARGEMLITTLTTDGMISVRESAGDVHQVSTEPCPCGGSGFRYKVVGRADDMLKVKGIMVYPSHIKGVINDFIPRVTGEMRIILDEKPPRVVPPLKIRVEHGADISAGQLDTLANEISDAMSRRLKINPQIIWAAPGSLERSMYKGKVFEKTYEDKGAK